MKEPSTCLAVAESVPGGLRMGQGVRILRRTYGSLTYHAPTKGLPSRERQSPFETSPPPDRTPRSNTCRVPVLWRLWDLAWALEQAERLVSLAFRSPSRRSVGDAV